jgi:hypothetical protein
MQLRFICSFDIYFFSIEITPEERQKNKDVAARLVKEERERKNILPKYPGLERFEIIEKVGE